MTTEERYVIALVLAEASTNEAQRDAYTDMSVELALTTDWSAEERMALRDAAGWVLQTLHPEVPLDDAVRLAISEFLGTCKGSVY